MSISPDAAVAGHCAVLGLDTVHSIDELNAAYRPLILQWHPDRHHGTPGHAIAIERAQIINEAYAVLLAMLQRRRAAKPAVKTATPGNGFPDASVLEIFVKASAVVSVGYNRATAHLYVKYVGNRIYRYAGVPPTAFEALLLASSASVFVREHIDRQYEYEVLKRTT